jgi:hypothetical protein
LKTPERLPITIRSFVKPAAFGQLALAALIGALLGGCATNQNLAAEKARAAAARPAVAKARPAPARTYWDDDKASGDPKIVVRLSEQRALFYKGKALVGESRISTGRRGFETPPGKYRVIQKDENHASNLYGSYVNEKGEVVEGNVEVGKDPKPNGTEFRGAAMPYFLRFTGGYGMHAGVVPRYRASHGCIRMPREMAKHFFDAADLDTPVVVEN